jgi:molybdenum transport protein
MLLRLSDADIERWLAEDVPYGDLTTQALQIGLAPGCMVFRAGADMVASSTEEAARLLVLAGARVDGVVPSGSRMHAGEVLLTADGPAAALLAGWKVAQTLVEYASGIASAARRIVDAARAVNPAVVVACTRKTFPGTKAVAVKAIMAGGASAHRLGLSESVLLFPEHRAFFGDRGLAEVVAGLRSACPEKKIVVEVVDAAQAEEAIRAGADVVQLERFSPAATRAVVEAVGGGATVIAAAGGVNAANAAEYAAAGALVLVTSAPYSASPVDVKVRVVAASSP